MATGKTAAIIGGMSILLLANGDLDEVNWLIPQLSEAKAVIAVDGGARHLARLACVPDFLVGDLDSLDSVLIENLEEAGTEILRYPIDKDETDLELALLFAAGQPGWQNQTIKVAGVLGGRLDQTLANILLLAHPALNGRDVRIIGAEQSAWLVTDQTEIEGEVGDIVSLVPLGGPVEIEATTGLKWPLIDETLTFGPARGISNRLVNPVAVVKLHRGRLLCIHTSGSWGR